MFCLLNGKDLFLEGDAPPRPRKASKKQIETYQTGSTSRKHVFSRKIIMTSDNNVDGQHLKLTTGGRGFEYRSDDNHQWNRKVVCDGRKIFIET